MSIVPKQDQAYLNIDIGSYNYVCALSNVSIYQFGPHKIEVIQSDARARTKFTNIAVPVSILHKKSALQAIVLYLKDMLGLSLSSIANILSRDPRTIWSTYNSAKTRGISIVVDESLPFVPISLFASRSFSVLETIVFYLRLEQGIGFSEIADILGKNYRTIWTVYRRVLEKIGDVTLGGDIVHG